MTTRDQLVERVAVAMTGRTATGWTPQDHEPVSTLGPDTHASIMLDLVREVLDLALPEVRSPAELEALPRNAWLMHDAGGSPLVPGSHSARAWVFAGGSLTVVWQPEAGDRS